MNRTFIHAGNDIVSGQDPSRQGPRAKSLTEHNNVDYEIMQMLSDFQNESWKKNNQSRIYQPKYSQPQYQYKQPVIQKYKHHDQAIDFISKAVKNQNSKLSNFMESLDKQQQEEKYLASINQLQNKVETLENMVNYKNNKQNQFSQNMNNEQVLSQLLQVQQKQYMKNLSEMKMMNQIHQSMQQQSYNPYREYQVPRYEQPKQKDYNLSSSQFTDNNLEDKKSDDMLPQQKNDFDSEDDVNEKKKNNNQQDKNREKEKEIEKEKENYDKEIIQENKASINKVKQEEPKKSYVPKRKSFSRDEEIFEREIFMKEIIKDIIPNENIINQSTNSIKNSISRLRKKLRKIIWVVIAAIKWMKVTNAHKTSEYSMALKCQEQLKKISEKTLGQRIKVWCGMVLAKIISLIIQDQKMNSATNFIELNQKQSKQLKDQMKISFTLFSKIFFQSIELFSQKEYFVSELKFLTFLQFFSDNLAEHSVFVSKRVKFWTKTQSYRSKQKEQLVICEFILFYNLIPSLFNLNQFDNQIDMNNPNVIFKIKAVASLTQIIFFEYFQDSELIEDLQIKHVVQKLAFVKENNGALGLEADEINKENLKEENDMPYIFGLYSRQNFEEIINERSKWYAEIKQIFQQILNNLYDRLTMK